jgi:glutathione S-transferase
MTIQKIYGTDLVQQYLPTLNDYMQRLEQRPAFSKVAADRAAALEAFFKK